MCALGKGERGEGHQDRTPGLEGAEEKKGL